MKLVISDKNKKDIFTSLFQVLKNCSSIISLIFTNDKLHIQGMDKSHVCLFDVKIMNHWFDEYIHENKYIISIDSQVFYSIICTKNENQSIQLYFDNENNNDTFSIHLISKESKKGEFDKFFKIPIVDFEYELLEIPDVEYDAEFSIHSKQICDIFSQMMNFGNDINIICNEEKINLITNGVNGEMLVNIPIDDLNEYSISEGYNINLNYSISYINKMCLTNKLTNNIEFYISSYNPMKINYYLDNDSRVSFYIAPKIED
jgi:proliferating cell nuclear antigen PCNA